MAGSAVREGVLQEVCIPSDRPEWGRECWTERTVQLSAGEGMILNESESREIRTLGSTSGERGGCQGRD